MSISLAESLNLRNEIGVLATALPQDREKKCTDESIPGYEDSEDDVH